MATYDSDKVKRMREIKKAGAKAKAGAKIAASEKEFRAMLTAARLEKVKPAKAASAGKAAKTVLGSVAKFATKKSVIGIVGLTAASSLIDYLNKNSITGKAVSSGVVAAPRGGSTTGFRGAAAAPKVVPKVSGGNSPIQKGTFKGPRGIAASSTGSGNKYRVSSGDTLSGIASRAGVSLAALRAANPQITDPRKIFRNTGVNIPKGGKMPSGGYTGPVPYRAPKKK